MSRKRINPINRGLSRREALRTFGLGLAALPAGGWLGGLLRGSTGQNGIY